MDEYWPHVVDGVQEALRGRSISLGVEDVYWGLKGRTMLLWLAEDEDGAIHGAGVTEIVHMRRVRVCQLLTVSGLGLKAWQPFMADLEDYARQQGCVAMEGAGRPGWTRIAPDYKPVYTIYRKMLGGDDGRRE